MCSLRENIHEIVTVHSVHSNDKTGAGILFFQQPIRCFLKNLMKEGR